ncbi:hypothetical protein EON79_08960 [bacterium]|nr:MAG: hypothetical protein EON79_08960 [bacterium]
MLLHYAIKWGDIETIRRLVAEGREVDERDSWDGETPLMWALDSPHAGPEVVRVLIELGADVNAKGKYRTIYGKKCTPAKLGVLLAHGSTAHQEPSESGDFVSLFANLEMLRMLLDSELHPTLRRAALSMAVADRDHKALSLLQSYGTGIDELELSPLALAFDLGSPEEVRECLRGVTDQETLDGLWYCAIYSGSIENCETILAAGANPTYRNEYGETLLMEAASSRMPQIVQWLLALGLPVDDVDEEDETALDKASGCGGYEVVKTLLDAGADPHRRSEYRNGPIEDVTDFRVIELLVEHGVDIDSISSIGYWPLVEAVRIGDEELVVNLIRLGAKVDNTFTGGTALTLAVQIDERRIARTLLAAGADPNQEDVDGKTPLHYARTPQMARMLLDAGADPRRTDQYSETPLQTVDEPEVQRVLREAGANSLPLASESMSPLSLSVYAGQTHLARMHLESGAPVDWIEPDGETALIFAAQKGDEDMLELLIEFGADPNIQDRKGRTALHRAAAPETEPGYHVDFQIEAYLGEFGRDSALDVTEAMSILLRAGASPRVEDNDGKTPFLLACSVGRKSRVACLLPFEGTESVSRAIELAEARPPEDPQRAPILALLTGDAASKARAL